MMFNGKIAKIGKARLVGCRLGTSGSFDLFMSNSSTNYKTLEIDGYQYTLGSTQKNYKYSQILPITNTYFVARDNKNFFIESFGENNG